MRTYGRVIVGVGADGLPIKKWVEVTTDKNGLNDQVWLTTLAQACLLNLNESPFYADWGIPAKQAVLQQIPPDYYVSQLQRQFSQYFASILIARDQTQLQPTYIIQVVTHQGVILNKTVQVPV